MTEDWSGMIEWLKEHHSNKLGRLWNAYMRYERKHNSEYLNRKQKG